VTPTAQPADHHIPTTDWSLPTACPPDDLYHLGVSHTNETGPQTSEHVLHFCPLYKHEQNAAWAQGAMFAKKLWGFKEKLQITYFISTNE